LHTLHVESGWYLFAFCWWEVLGFALQSFPPPARFLGACLLAWHGEFISLGFMEAAFIKPAIVLLPVFVLGQMFPLPRALESFPLNVRSICLGLLSLVVVAGLEYIGPVFNWREQLPTFSYNTGNNTGQCESLELSLVWFRSLAMHWVELFKVIVVLLTVCPRVEVPLVWGGNWLYAWLLNPLIIDQENKFLPFDEQKWNFAGARIWLRPPFLAIIAIVNVVILCSPPIRFALRAVLEPSWLERLTLGATGGTEAGDTAEAVAAE